MGAIAALLLALPLISSNVHAGYYNLGGFWQSSCREMDSTWAPDWGNLVGYWKFNGTGSLAPGSPVWPVAGPIGFTGGASMSYEPGRDNQGLEFGGLSYVAIPNSPQLNLSGNTVTVSAWVSSQGAGQQQTIFFSGTSASASTLGFSLGFDSTNTHLQFEIGDGTGNVNIASATAPPPGYNWHLVTGVADGSNVWLYIDGVAMASATQTISALGTSTNEYCIGNASLTGSCDASKYFNGTLDEVAVWSTALTPAQVTQLYTDQSSCRGVSPPLALAFTSASQTLTPGACSSEATVSYVNTLGIPISTSSNITVSLSGGGFTFYQDASCSTQITSVTIPSGSSGANFYMESSGSNYIITGSATGLPSAMQLESINSGTGLSGYTYLNGSYDNTGNLDWDTYFGYSWAGNMVAFNGQLFMSAWNSWFTNYNEVFVYNGNDSSPSWTDSNGGNSMTYGNDGSGPMLAVYNGYIFGIWQESNGSNEQIRVKKYNGVTQCGGSYWCPADSGSLNVNTGLDAENPTLAVYNGNLYAAWDENELYVHVAVYQGGTTWKVIDDDGFGHTTGTSMNYDASECGREPSLFGSSQGLIASWAEDYNCYALRVKVFNGTSWTQADGGSGIQYSYIDQYEQGNVGSFAAYNDKVYVAWVDYPENDGAYTGIHVSVYGGGANWTPVDGGQPLGIQYQLGSQASPPTLVSYQGRLYAVWSENDSTTDVSYDATQTRVAVYNGNDSAPSWSLVIAPSTDGMDYIPWNDSGSWGQPVLTPFNNKLYMAWDDVEMLDTAVFTQGTTPTQLWFPNLSNNGNDGGVDQTSGCVADEVRTADASGHPSNVSSNTTVTLTVTGLNLYEDDLCTIPLPSNQVTINAGDNGAHFFFLVETGNGNYSLSGTSTGGLSGSGSQSLSNSLDDIWVGGASCNGNWTSGVCWSQGAPPGEYGNAIFGGSLCTTNCSATINTSNLNNMNNILMESDYTGTVTQKPGKSPTLNGTLQIEGGTFAASTSSADSLTIGDLYLVGGAFNAGSANVTLYNLYQTGGTFTNGANALAFGDGAYQGGTFWLYGGTFTAPNASGSWTFTSGDLDVSGSPTFNANGGTVVFAQTGTTYQINPGVGAINFNNVTFQGGAGGAFCMQGTMNVLGNLIVSNSNAGGSFFSDCGNNGSNSQAVIAVSGNVTANSGSPDSPGDGSTNMNTILELVGSGTQNFSSSADALPADIMIASTGTVNLSGTIYAAAWIYDSGTVNAGTSTVNISDGGYGPYANNISSGSMHFYNLAIGNGSPYSIEATAVGTVYVDGNLTVDIGDGNLNGGTFSIGGNFSQINNTNNGGGTAALTFTGGNAQTFSYSAGTLPQGAVTVAKTAGTTLTLDDTVTLGSGLTITSGTLVTGSNSMTIPGDVLINDTLTAGSGTLTVGGSFTDNGTFTPGTSTVKFTNSNDESPFTIGGSSAPTFDNLTINASGATGEQTNTITLNGNLTITSGTLNSNGYNLTVGGNFANSGTYTAGGNTVTLAAGASHTFTGNSTTFNNLVMNDSGNSAADTLTFVKGKTYTVSGALTLEGNSTNRLKLRSSTTGTQWKIKPTAWTVSYVDVEDSDNTASSAIAPTNSLDSGDNTNWGFTYNSPSYRQSVATAVPGSNCTACTSSTLGENTLANSLIVVAVVNGAGGSASSVTDNASGGSNSYSKAATETNTGTAEIWYAVGANAGANQVTVNYSSGTKPAIYVYEFTSAGTSNPVDKTDTNDGTGTSLTATATTNFANEVVVSVAYGAKSLTSTDFAALAGESNGTSWYADSSYAVESTAGTYGGTWTQSSSNWAETTVTFRGSNQ